ncbi:methyltransferase domain-containing protein [Actinocrinis puniceicyclus]|uniref:Methyltransferase domain-containing protein n=1 Tax=Actinocrinis puniceicyclus TaxID=977794 RepID=A0A8J8B9M7_9ACTN|nr:class I SAM-dependent methyltransferase [Actinocrinis puniceicyclus]MBS2962002.1 methyltransferase domain-containing protein [Actinocrinis puniceicyclus]
MPHDEDARTGAGAGTREDAGTRGDTGEEATAVYASAAQSEAWNGASGQHWVEYRDRHEAQLRNFLPPLLAAADIAAGEHVLDVGCGCGCTTLHAARAAADGHALGVDLSEPMLAEARRRAAAEGVANVAFEQADAQLRPFAPGAFDVMVSRLGVMFFADPRAAFGNVARALRPGGRLAFLCWQPVAVNGFVSVPHRALSAHITVPNRDTPGEPGPFSLADPDEVRGLLTSAGCDGVDISAVAEPMWIGTDVEDAVAYHLTSPSSRTAFAGVDEQTRERAIDALREELGAHRTPRGVELEGRAWLVTARKP